MDTTATGRQAMLKPEHADRYPSLPASAWTSAAHMVELVAEWPRAPGSPGNANHPRRLSEEDFEFRGAAKAVRGGMTHRRAGEDDLPRQ
jgi:hypothetical protein